MAAWIIGKWGTWMTWVPSDLWSLGVLVTLVCG